MSNTSNKLSPDGDGFSNKGMLLNSNDRKGDNLVKVYANRYQFVKKLGSGKSGIAYLVDDLDPKTVAKQKVLKEIRADDIDPEDTHDAMHEARLLRKINHPFVVKFYDNFLDGNSFCIVTEYCEGGDLDQVITRTRKNGSFLSEDRVLQWTVQLILGVNFIHAQRILHRDIKSRNIFLKQNQVKIGDFGISRFLHDTTDMASSFLGTPYYMSPEVLTHNAYNSKADIWSIGCVLFELCALHHPFEGSGLMGIMFKILDEPCPKLPSVYSQDMQDLLENILVKDPTQRPSTSEILEFPTVVNCLQTHREEFGEALNPTYFSKYKMIEKPQQPSMGLTPQQRKELRRQQEHEKRRQELSMAAVKEKEENMKLVRLQKEKTFATSAMNPLNSRPSRLSSSNEFQTTLVWNEIDSNTSLLSPSSLDYATITNERPSVLSLSSESIKFKPQTTLYSPRQSYNHERWVIERTLDVTETSEDETLKELKAHFVQQSMYDDDRPIQPMTNMSIYDLNRTNEEIKEEILNDPTTAEMYYNSDFEPSADEQSPDSDDRDEELTIKATRKPSNSNIPITATGSNQSKLPAKSVRKVPSTFTGEKRNLERPKKPVTSRTNKQKS